MSCSIGSGRGYSGNIAWSTFRKKTWRIAGRYEGSGRSSNHHRLHPIPRVGEEFPGARPTRLRGLTGSPKCLGDVGWQGQWPGETEGRRRRMEDRGQLPMAREGPAGRRRPWPWPQRRRACIRREAPDTNIGPEGNSTSRALFGLTCLLRRAPAAALWPAMGLHHLSTISCS